MTNKSISTKFGNACLSTNGYYVISSKPYKNKFLHILIFEDYYGVCVCDWAVIHHKDFNKQNNDIFNLELMSKSDHVALHHSGKNHYMNGKRWHEEYCINMSKSMKNSTGYLRVSKHPNKRYKQGFTWKYRYYDENKKRKSIYSVDLNELKQKVLEKNLPWIELGQVI